MLVGLEKQSCHLFIYQHAKITIQNMINKIVPHPNQSTSIESPINYCYINSVPAKKSQILAALVEFMAD
jgi:hypothetical protein